VAIHLSNAQKVSLVAGTLLSLMPLALFAETQKSPSSLNPEISVPPVKVIELDTQQEALNITDDIGLAEAQVKAYPESPEAQLLLSIAYSRSPQHFEKAIRGLQRTKRLIKRSPEGYGTIEKLLTNYEEMLTYRPDDPKILYRLAFGYYLKGYLIENRYLQTPSESPEPLYDQAEVTMRRVFELEPTDIWARNYLGYLLVERKGEENLDQAIGLWEDSLKVSADNPGASLMLGEAYLKKGNLKKAMKYATKGFQALLPFQ
jgi:tetratricopeptide (TPR) repeat protein